MRTMESCTWLRMVRAAAWVALAAGLGLLGCSGATVLNVGERCSGDEECNPGAVCHEERCRWLCQGGNDCAPDEDCDGGLCLPVPNAECARHADCDAPPACHLAEGATCSAGRCGYPRAGNGTSCDDGDPCTVTDTCLAGVCLGMGEPLCECGSNLDCDDHDPCTTDECDPDGVCVHSYNTEPCDDGDACTEQDTCDGAGQCQGDPITCDDDNACTDDSCDPASGCVFTNDDANSCDDGFPCTTGDHCASGACTYTAVDGCPRSPVAVGENFTCAVRSTTGALACWGDGQWGRLGTGDEADRVTPTDVLDVPTPVVAVSAGGHHACALAYDSSVWCWGYDASGQVGGGGDDSPERCGSGTIGIQCSTRPVRVQGLPPDIRSISAGLYHGCAVSAQGQAYCWGGNYSGELGTGEDGYSTRTAVEATAANAEGTIVQISAGGSHTCALLGSETNRVRCWGQQSNGRLGNGSTEGAVVPIPQTVVLANVGSVAAGYNGTCAVLTNGAVRCWGDDRILGTAASTDSAVPVATQAASASAVAMKVQSILARACTITTSGGAQCWGHCGQGSCGDGATTDNLTPNAVTGAQNVVALATGNLQTCVMNGAGELWCTGRRCASLDRSGSCVVVDDTTLAKVLDFP